MGSDIYLRICELFETAELSEILENIASYCRNNDMHVESEVLHEAIGELSEFEDEEND